MVKGREALHARGGLTVRGAQGEWRLISLAGETSRPPAAGDVDSRGLREERTVGDIRPCVRGGVAHAVRRERGGCPGGGRGRKDQQE